MNKDEKLTVNLSKQTTSVALPRDPGKALRHLMAAEKEWVSWSDLQDVGVINPTEAIFELEKYGAVIKTIIKDTVTSKWDIHLDAPNYKYCGWHFDACLAINTTNPYKESA